MSLLHSIAERECDLGCRIAFFHIDVLVDKGTFVSSIPATMYSFVILALVARLPDPPPLVVLAPVLASGKANTRLAP